MRSVFARSAAVRSMTVLAGAAAVLCPRAAVSAPKPPATDVVSVTSSGATGDHDSDEPSISSGGRFVAFSSSATDLVPNDTNASRDVFVRDRARGTTTRVSVDGEGRQVGEGGSAPAISANGRYVAFESSAVGIVPDKTTSRSDIVVRDLRAGTTTRISTGPQGEEGDGSCYYPRISANGRYVAFQSTSTNLVAGDTNGTSDVFVHDRKSGTTVRASVGAGGNESTDGGAYPALSANGRFVAFNSSGADLVAGDLNQMTDIFVRDLKRGTTTRVSTSTDGGEGNGQCYLPTISSNGRMVAFVSESTNLVRVNLLHFAQVYLHDAKSGVTTRISGFTVDVEGNGSSDAPSISANGKLVAFSSNADNLVSGDTVGEQDIFVHDVRRGTVARVSVSSLGAEAELDSYDLSISPDGRLVAFSSQASNLAPGDANSLNDVFVRTLK